jgi:hypothetical protein
LVECAARYAAAAALNRPEANPAFTIYMLGLGWMTILAHIDGADAIASEFSKRVQQRLQDLHAASIVPVLPTVVCEYPKDPKAVVARGAARCLDVQRQAPANSRRSFLLQDVRVTTSSDDKFYSWSTRIPLESDGEILQLQAIDLGKFAFEWTTSLPPAVQWTSELRERCVYKNVIVHSPFRVFLSEYKKGG